VLTVVSKAIASVAKLPANNIPLVVKLPLEMMTNQAQGDTLYSTSATTGTKTYRYVRATYTVTGTSCNLTAGSISCMFVTNAPVTIDRPM